LPAIAGLRQLLKTAFYFFALTTMTDTAAESLSATSDESPDVPIELSTPHSFFLLLCSHFAYHFF